MAGFNLSVVLLGILLILGQTRFVNCTLSSFVDVDQIKAEYSLKLLLECPYELVREAVVQLEDVNDLSIHLETLFLQEIDSLSKFELFLYPRGEGINLCFDPRLANSMAFSYSLKEFPNSLAIAAIQIHAFFSTVLSIAVAKDNFLFLRVIRVNGAWEVQLFTRIAVTDGGRIEELVESFAGEAEMTLKPFYASRFRLMKRKLFRSKEFKSRKNTEYLRNRRLPSPPANTLSLVNPMYLDDYFDYI